MFEDVRRREGAKFGAIHNSVFVIIYYRLLGRVAAYYCYKHRGGFTEV